MRARPAVPSSSPFIDALGHGAGDRRIDILRGIAATGSISQAARDVGVSYKAAWQAIDTLTNLAGVSLVRRTVGGAGGGGAALTGQGLRLLELAQALDAARHEVHARWLASGGETEGTVDQGGGAAGSAGAAAATLSRLSLRTSMRNQLPATVERLETTGRIVRVVMRLGGHAGDPGPRAACLPGRDAHTDIDTGAVSVDTASVGATADRVAALITRESAELLGLRPGLPVIALCKATAVRVERAAAGRGDMLEPTGPDAPPGPVDSPAANRLEGTVRGATRGEGGDELAVALPGGLQLIGFAAGGTDLRTRQRVRAWIDEAALVVALAG